MDNTKTTENQVTPENTQNTINPVPEVTQITNSNNGQDPALHVEFRKN